jgi:putative ABC transport system substrate-binding protein
LGILKTATPDAVRIAALWNPANRVFQAQQLQETEKAAQKLGLKLQLIEARASNDFEAALATVEETRSLFIMVDPLFILNASTLAELSLKYNLVTITGNRAFPVAGGLMAYGPNYFDLYKRAAFYIDRILKGAKPADLPVEQPTKFHFVINLRTAKALSIDLSSSIVALADEVIE